MKNLITSSSATKPAVNRRDIAHCMLVKGVVPEIPCSNAVPRKTKSNATPNKAAWRQPGKSSRERMVSLSVLAFNPRATLSNEKTTNPMVRA
jgi:hypothetical protein